MSSQRKQSSSQATARRWKSRIQRLLLALLFLQLIIVGVGLYYTDNLNFIFPKKNTPLHTVALEKNNPVEKKAAVIVEINKPVTQPQKSVTPEDTEKSRTEGDTKPVLSRNRESATVAKPVTEVINQKTSDHYYYTVQAGDNLGLISKEVYGTLTKWRVIANANTDQLENNPNRLRPGMTLVIPALTETGDILLRPGVDPAKP